MMNKWRIGIIGLLLITQTSFGQKVDTLELNGESYLVYPFKLSVGIHSDYYTVLDAKKSMKYRLKKYERELKNEMDINSVELEMLLHELSFEARGKSKSRKHLNGKFRRAARKNPYPLLEQRYTLNRDIIPSLDPIPDGKYVQLFDDFCMTDKKGGCQEETKRIAGYFSIKNNMLNGEAYWLNLNGDTLKSGVFKDGLKQGVWKLSVRRTQYTLNKKDAEMYVELGHPRMDTTVIICEYVNGAMTGHYRRYYSSKNPVEEGMLLEGEEIGEWIYREVTYEGFGRNKKRNRNNSLVTFRYTVANQDTINTKKPWIRKGLIETYGADYKIFDFSSRYDVQGPMLDLFEYAFEKEPDLDLEEEMSGSYGLDEYEDEFGDHQIEGGDYSHSSFQPMVFDGNREESFSRGYVIDSIGMIAKYDGVCEKIYPNGQLMVKYVFENGELEREDTIYWDNGKAHDVIHFIADSNQFERSIYDYTGKLYKQLVFDSLGDYVRTNFEHDDRKYVFLGGFKADDPVRGKYYFYDHNDTLLSELSEPLVVFRSWYKQDSSVLYNMEFDPNLREHKRYQYAATGAIVAYSEKTFGEGFESWTGKRTMKFGPLELKTTASGALYSGWLIDSIPQNNVNFAFNRFDVAS
ncbi:MAG: hypothetical protein JKY09_02025, partial [Crocinitomicaceae bacterium]|nr:hypothetical protein [Crocinitomicaceae bacterium]